MAIHGDGQEKVHPTSQFHQPSQTIWQHYAGSINPDFPTIQQWVGKNKPSHAEIVQAIAEIKCYGADATAREALK